MDGCFSVRRKLNHSSFYPLLLPGASKPHMIWPLGLLWPLLLAFFPPSSLLLLWLQWPPDCSLNLPGLFPCQGFCTYFSLECIYSRYLQGLLPSPSGLCSNVTSLSHKAFPDHPISKCRYRHIPDCGRLWSKGGHNNIFYPTCSFAMLTLPFLHQEVESRIYFPSPWAWTGPVTCCDQSMWQKWHCVPFWSGH